MWLIDWIREIWQENADMLHRMWNEDVIYEWWQMLIPIQSTTTYLAWPGIRWNEEYQL